MVQVPSNNNKTEALAIIIMFFFIKRCLQLKIIHYHTIQIVVLTIVRGVFISIDGGYFY